MLALTVDGVMSARTEHVIPAWKETRNVSAMDAIRVGVALWITVSVTIDSLLLKHRIFYFSFSLKVSCLLNLASSLN